MIIKYFNEIKNRIFFIALSYFFFIISSFHYKQSILKLTVLLNNELSNNVINYFIFTSITELFSIYIDLSFFISNFLLYFKFFYHSICFLSSGLYIKEYKTLKNFFFLSIFSAIISLFFCQTIFLPFLTKFFLNFNIDSVKYVDFYFEAKISDYLMFYKNVFYKCFLNSQILAIIIIVLNSINYYRKDFFIINRKYLYIFFLITSTVITPPDIFSQVLFCSILIILFEINIFIKIIKSQ